MGNDQSSPHGPLAVSSCSICSLLSGMEYASQKFGWEENDTHLPEAANQLRIVKDLRPDSSRSLILKQCPECGTYYLYQTNYEYLVNGSEDEQQLSRISNEDAENYLA